MQNFRFFRYKISIKYLLLSYVVSALALFVSCVSVNAEPSIAQKTEAVPEKTTNKAVTLSDEQRAYVKEVWNTIDVSFNPPQEFVQRGFCTLVRLKIDKNGTILNSVIDQTSRNAQFDDFVLTTIQNLGSLPPVPDSFGSEPIEIRFRLRASQQKEPKQNVLPDR